MKRTDGITQAAVLLVGSILHLDLIANAGVMALELKRGSIFNERRLSKGIEGSLTQAVRGLNSAKSADIDAAREAVEKTLQGFRATEPILRASADSGRLKNFLLAANPEPHELIRKDPAAEHCFQIIMAAVIDRVAQEIRASKNAVIPLLLEAHDQLGNLDGRTARLETGYISNMLALEALGKELIYDKTRVSGIIEGLHQLKGLDCRPRCSFYIESPNEFESIDKLLASHGIASVWGPPLSGRFELLRQWCQRAGKPDVVVIDCRMEGGLKTGVDALARRRNLQPQQTAASTLAKICDAISGITVVLDGIESDGELTELERHLRPGPSATLAVLEFQPRPLVVSAFRLSHLGAEDITLILKNELTAERFEGSLDGIDSVAQALVGLPLLAKQAASYIADCCESVDQYRMSLEKNLNVTFQANTRVDERTAEVVWSYSLNRVQKRLGRPGICALAILDILSGKALHGAWEGSIGFLLSGEELGNQEIPRSIARYLSRLSLVEDDGVFFQAANPFLSYTWETLSDTERKLSTEAMLRLILLFASQRASRDPGTVNGVMPVTSERYFQLRQYSPVLFDTVTIQAAICLGEFELEEYALWVLDRLLQIQATDKQADSNTTLLNMANIALQDDLVGSVRFALAVAEEARASEDPLVQIQANLLSARGFWANGDLAPGLSAITDAVKLLEGGFVEGDDAILVGMNVYRLRGWFRIALNDEVSGVADLCRGIAIGESDDRFWYAASEARAGAIGFLMDRGVTPPQELLAALSVAFKSPTGGRLASTANKVLAESQRAIGDLDKAESYLDSSPLIGFGPLDSACKIADQLQRKAQLIIERINSGERKFDRQRAAQDGIDFVDEALRGVNALPEELRDRPRARRITAGLRANRSALLLTVEKTKQAVWEAREALAIDLVEFGDNHREYAQDAYALGIALVCDSQAQEARSWFEVAHRIFSRPGPHTNLVNANLISKDWLSMYPS